MKNFSKILLISAILFIAGCSTTPNEMRADAKERGVMQIDLPFSTVRQNFLSQAKKCYAGNLRVSYSEHVVEDVKPGELTTLNILHKGATSTVRVTHSFDIRKNSAGGTEISWFIAGVFVAKYQAVVESWAKGQEGKCGMITDK